MSFNRLVFIKAIISFDDANMRQERWQTARFSAFRETFEEFNKCCAKNMSPDDYIAIDETLYPTRGGILFKTYNKDKLAKYGLNFRNLGSSRYPFIYYTVSYTGNSVEVTESHIKVTLNLVKRIVEGCEQHEYSLKDTNISMDCYRTSISLTEWLYEKNITWIGTLNSIKKGCQKNSKKQKAEKKTVVFPAKATKVKSL